MKRWRMVTLALYVLFGIASSANATVLDFELGVTTSFAHINSLNPTYGGFTWDSNIYIESLSDFKYNNNNTNTANFPSGVDAAFNAYGTTVSVAGGPINLNGAWFRGWSMNDIANNYTSTSVTIEGFLGGVSKGSATMALDPTHFLFLSTNFGSLIDSFTITSSASSGKWWLMDDLTFNNTTPVPEPSTMLLLGSGLAGLAGYGRRRFKK